jgi:hypothetical protein
VLQSLVRRVVRGIEQERGVVLDYADREAQSMVQRGHPLGVPLGQIVVDGHQMGAFPGERIEIQRQGRH